MTLDTNHLTLESTFEGKGFWWLPESPNNRVGGTLNYSKDGILLELHGTLTLASSRRPGPFPENLDSFPLIHGMSDAVKYTLVRASCISLTRNFSEITGSSFSAIYLLLGTHVSDAELPSDSVSFSCSHLDDFLGQASFTIEDDGVGSTLRGTTIGYVAPTHLAFALPSESAQLKFEQNLWRSRDRSKICLTARNTISLTPESPQPFHWHLERIWQMCSLLTLLADEIVRPERIEVSVSGGPYPHVLFYNAQKPQRESNQPSSNLLFNASHVCDQLGDILNRWFTASPTLRSAIYLYIDGMRQAGSSEGRFLTLSQAFEAFSRATTTSEYMATEDYEQVKSKIIEAIPSHVASDHRDSLKSRIKYGNEISLRKRLMKTFDSLPVDAIDCICHSLKEFVSGIVDTRNYLTHYSDELRPLALRGADLHWTSEQLAMLTRILLLRSLGIDIARIVEHVRSHSRLMQYRQLYLRHPKSK